MAKIDVLGAGVAGLWQAFVLQGHGHKVSLWDPGGAPSRFAASRFAGAMLAPYCEGEAGHELVRDLGVESIGLWCSHYPQTIIAGSLVVAGARDQADLRRFAAATAGHRWLDGEGVAELEPDLGGRYGAALFYPDEGYVETGAALEAIARAAVEKGVAFHREARRPEASSADWVIDCRGIAAKDRLKSLRGVRGERIIIECKDVRLSRPIRLLHPRIPFYIVPWAGGRFAAGATNIESEDEGETTLRSALELLSAAYALLPAFAEARVVEIAAGVRPAFPDNIPKILVRGRHIFVNGLYRHGFLLAPILAKTAAEYIQQGAIREGVVFEDHGEW